MDCASVVFRRGEPQRLRRRDPPPGCVAVPPGPASRPRRRSGCASGDGVGRRWPPQSTSVGRRGPRVAGGRRVDWGLGLPREGPRIAGRSALRRVCCGRRGALERRRGGAALQVREARHGSLRAVAHWEVLRRQVDHQQPRSAVRRMGRECGLLPRARARGALLPIQAERARAWEWRPSGSRRLEA